MQETDVAAIVARTISQCYQPRHGQTIWQWADENVLLDNIQSPGRTGFYDSSLTPWNRRIMECDQDPDVSCVTVPKSSRSGVTEAIFNIWRWAPRYDPGHCAYMLQNQQKVRSAVRRRMIPTLERCVPEYFTGDRDDVSLSVIRLVNMQMDFFGSGSEAPWTEIAYKRVCLDEYDDLDQAGQDQTTADLARSRQRDVPNSTLYILGKCKRRGGPISREFWAGTQEIFLIPCPNCNDLFEPHEGGLRFDHVRNDLLRDLHGGALLDELIDQTRYECPACGHLIHERHKPAMVNAGEWHPTPWSADKRPPQQHFLSPIREGQKEYPAFSMPGHVSLRISDFTSLHEKLSWGHLALLMIEAERNPQKRKDLIIEHTGRGFDDSETAVDENDITASVGGWVDPETKQPQGIRYARGECPIADPVMVSVQADVQQWGVKWSAHAWEINGDWWLIDYGSLMGGVENLDQILDRCWPVKDHPGQTVQYRDRCGLIDSRHRMDEVYQYCLDRNYRIFPSKGIGQKGETCSIAFVSQVRSRWVARNRYVAGFHYNDKIVKDRFYEERLKKLPGRPRAYFPHDIEESYVNELTSNQKVSGFDKLGQTVYYWKELSTDDWGDCAKKAECVWALAKDTIAAEREAEAAIDTPAPS